MSLIEKDIKLLWGRAASRCSFPECRLKLTYDKNLSSDAVPLGQQAHIVAEKSDDIRGKSPLTEKERNTYFNHILLCPTHHTLIDKAVEDFPIERLHMIKAEHELWVDQTLSDVADRQRQAYDLIYSTLVDAAVEGCQLFEWRSWTANALQQPPIWTADTPGRLFRFRQKIQGALWPGKLPELEQALNTLSIAISQALAIFSEHADSDATGEMLEGDRFYKINEWNPEKYKKLTDEYKVWLDQCSAWIFETAKAANWLADVVRRDINPLFFAEQGKFLLHHGPYAPDFHYITSLAEYTAEEKIALPASLEQRLLDDLVQEAY